MAKKKWDITLDGKAHVVDLEHSYWSGKREVTIDGKPADLPPAEKKKLFDTGSTHAFTLGMHKLEIRIRTNGLTYQYDLAVDGISQETGQGVQTSTSSVFKPSLRWTITPEEYDWQINHYQELKLTKSYHGQVILLFLFFQLVTFLSVFLELLSWDEFLISFILYILCLFFIYRGSRVAMIVLLLLWTFDKGYTMVLSMTEGLGTPIGSIVFWVLGSLLVLKALRIENERQRRQAIITSTSV